MASRSWGMRRARDADGLTPGSGDGSTTAVTEREPAPSRLAPTGQVWNIPAPVRGFTGRDSQPSPSAAISSHSRGWPWCPPRPYGLGGISTTQLARAYAHRYRDDYQLGWWTGRDASDDQHRTRRTGGASGRRGRPARTRAVEQRSRGLVERNRGLLACDNATDPAALERLLPAPQ